MIQTCAVPALYLLAVKGAGWGQGWPVVMAWVNGLFKYMQRPELSYYMIIVILFTDAVFTFVSSVKAKAEEEKAA